MLVAGTTYIRVDVTSDG